MIFLSHLCYNMILLKQTEIWKRFYAKHLQSKYRRHQSADRHTLSPDWQEILEDIIPQLDEESQTIVKNTILSPKGITYSKSTGKFFAKKTRDARSNFTIICFTQQTAHQSCPSFARHL